MTSAPLDILGIGNAIVDVLARADDAFLSRHGMARNAMRLIDTAEAERITAAMAALPGGTAEAGGGSAANTCAVAAALGARVGFLGKVAADPLGRVFAADLERIGVRFPTAPLDGGDPTARCLILVTPDGQRTMNTYLGACVSFGPDDVDEASVRAAAVTYLEGYLFDPPRAQDAFHRAAAIARDAGRRVAITLSDPFCVGRHRDAFAAFLRDRADILFCNEAEAMALTGAGDFAETVAALAVQVPLAVVTRSELGSVVVEGETVHEIAAVPTAVVDTTGAGDAYAAGFLAALTRGSPAAECGRWGSVAASEAISHMGARPVADLRALVGAD